MSDDYGLRLRNAAGTVTFDSRLATGGVCLGFETVPPGGGTREFPDIVGRSGIALNAWCVVPALMVSFDNALGYLRFTFGPLTAGGTYVLFAV